MWLMDWLMEGDGEDWYGDYASAQADLEEDGVTGFDEDWEDGLFDET